MKPALVLASVSMFCGSLLLPLAAFADEVAPVAESPAPDVSGAVVDDDVAPSMTIYSSKGATLALGGLLQMHLAPWVGADASIDNDDIATRMGFRLRRARLGVSATFASGVQMLLVLNPLTSDTETNAISDARLAYALHPSARLSVGADKVPFTRGELQSSSDLDSIEKPLSIRSFVPQRRLGATISGTALGDAFSYVVGLMNSTEGYELGNRHGGLLYVARVEYAIVGSRAAPSTELSLGVGAGALYEEAAATTNTGASVDVFFTLAGAGLGVEALCTESEPVDSPNISPALADKDRRCGAYAQVTYDVPGLGLRPALRAEIIDDNADVDDAGDATLFSAGVNYQLDPRTRFQIYYLGRHETESEERANDSVVLGLQGTF